VSTPIEGGRPLLRVRVLGFPVHLDLSFVIIMAVLGYYPGVTLRDMALWLLITPVAVLVHELGHAVAARSAGARPQIALAGFGGVTSFTLEIHQVDGRLPLRDAAVLFRHWRDVTNAERTDAWLAVLAEHGELVAALGELGGAA